MTDSETLEVYAREAERYATVIADIDGAEDTYKLQTFLRRLPADGQILDLGCGPGEFAAEMAKAGFSVDAWDAVAEMVALVERFPGVNAREAVFDDLSVTDHYDGIWANFSLLHAPKSELPRHLTAIAMALKSGGWLHIGVKLGNGEKRDSLGRQYSYFTEAELAEFLQRANFLVEERWLGEGRGLDGNIAPWIVMHARRRT